MFDWEEFLKLAEKLSASNSGDEAVLRTCISRAYYSMFHRSEEFCTMNGLPLLAVTLPAGRGTDNSRHMKLIHAMRSYRDTAKSYRTVNAAGRLLDTLRIKRVYADYNDGLYNNGVDKETAIAIAVAKKIIQTLDSF